MFELLFIIGLIAFIGFGGRWAFERTRVPEVLILLAVGFALGPLGLLSQFTLLDIDLNSFRIVAPFIGAVAIVSLVFEAGLRLKLEQVSKRISFSTAFALSNFVACVSVLTVILHFGFGWNLLSSLLLGAILGGPSSLAVYSMLPFVRTSNQARSVLYLEATLSTLLACALAISVMRYANTDMAGAGLFSALKMFFSSFSISLILGLAIGVAVLWALFRFKIKKFGYLLTLSALFMLYFIDFELLGGIGVISIAVIGLVIGNSGSVFKLLGVSGKFDLDETSKGFQEEISLFVSTFFFVYLGMVARPDYFTSLNNVAIAVALVAGILVARSVILWLAKKLGRSQQNENLLLQVMIPRNLLSATLAT
ncbi:MAG: cation:proton antiporter, partial [Candidatus Micrarchaeota archaeon]